MNYKKVVDQAKAQSINELNEKFAKARGAVLTEYRGMTVSQITDLRTQLREKSVEFKVIKNTLAKIAAKDTQFEGIIDHFTGPNSIAFSYDNVLAPAKVMVPFAKKDKNLKIKAGLVEGKAVDTDEITAMAYLPSKDVLLGKMLGALQAPVSNFAGVLGGILREFVYVLNAIKEKKGGN